MDDALQIAITRIQVTAIQSDNSVTEPETLNTDNKKSFSLSPFFWEDCAR